MKTTLELPDTLFRRAKSRASKDGITLKQFVTEAIREKINETNRGNAREPRWRRHFGTARKYAGELLKVDALIAAECGQIDPEDWK